MGYDGLGRISVWMLPRARGPGPGQSLDATSFTGYEQRKLAAAGEADTGIVRLCDIKAEKSAAFRTRKWWTSH